MTKESRAKRYKTYQERLSTTNPSPEAQNLKKGAEWQIKWMERQFPHEFDEKVIAEDKRLAEEAKKKAEEEVKAEVKSKGKK